MANRRKSHPVRTLVLLFVIIAAGVGALVGGNLTKKTEIVPALALDLAGGTQLILTPTLQSGQSTADQEARISQAINIIRQRIDASGVSEAEITSQGADNIIVSLPGKPSKETLDLVKSSALLRFRPVLKVQEGSAATTQQVVIGKDGKPVTQPGQPAKPAQALDDAAATKEADKNQDGQISTQMVGTPKSNSDEAWISEAVEKEFLMLNCSTKDHKPNAETDDPKKPLVACAAEGGSKYILGPVDVEGKELTAASSAMGQTQSGASTGKWEVNLQFNSAGAKQFGDTTTRLFSFRQSNPTLNRFAIVLDGKVVSAPGVESAITNGQARISGNFTQQSAATLANQLKFGSLPLNFKVQSQQQISATLGSEHLQKGIWAGIAGLILVVLYLIWQYRGLAIVAVGSLLTAAGMVYVSIALLSWLMGYRLSLAGVAGLIVAVGVTADSFIVYFERIRDEVRDGRPLYAAVEVGWNRAKRTIVASDAINLLAAAVLYLLAVGGVQGFAFTLGLTTIVDLAVVFMFSHPMMLLLLKLPFFGRGHKLSGLDPTHLGATQSTYLGRGRTRFAGTKSKNKIGKTGDDSTDTSANASKVGPASPKVAALGAEGGGK